MFFLKAATNEPGVVKNEASVKTDEAEPVLVAAPETPVDESAVPASDVTATQESEEQDSGGVLR